MRKFHVFFLLTIALVFDSALAEDLDYYFEASVIGGRVAIYLNGFLVFEKSQGSGSTSRWVTPLLVNGENTVRVSFFPARGSENSKFELSIVSHPHGQNRREELEETIVNRQLIPHTLWFARLASEEVIPIYGTLSSEDGSITFHSKEQHRIWGCSLTGEKLRSIPSKMEYTGLSHELTNVYIHFFKRNKPEHVVFGEFAMEAGFGSIEFERENVIKGLEWAEEGSIDSILIQGVSQSDEETKISALGFQDDAEILRDEFSFNLSMTQRWVWEDGEDVANLIEDEEEKEKLLQKVATIHDLLDARSLNRLGDVFGFKIGELSKALYQSTEELEKQQSTFFRELFQDPAWGLVPLDRDLLRCYPLNGKVIKVETMTGGEPIESNTIKDPSGGDGVFAVPLYFSHIEGNWEVIH